MTERQKRKLTNKVSNIKKTSKSQSPDGKRFLEKKSANSERPDDRKTQRNQPKMYPEGMTTQGKYSNNPCTDDGTITRKSANDIESICNWVSLYVTLR